MITEKYMLCFFCINNCILENISMHKYIGICKNMFEYVPENYIIIKTWTIYLGNYLKFYVLLVNNFFSV